MFSRDLGALILAAGVGSRLQPLTDTTPKCLVEVGGRPILGWQLDALIAAGAGPIAVVAGYRATDVIEFCRAYGDLVRVVVNADYAHTNNMVSLRLGLRGHEEKATIICNGDVVFDPAIAFALAGAPQASLIAVDVGRYIEESMKVTVDGSGRVTAISKAITQRAAYGVSIDLYRFSGEHVATLCRIADHLIEGEQQTNLWAEVAIDAALAEIPVQPFPIGAARWIEIDNLDDLAEGALLFGGVTT